MGEPYGKEVVLSTGSVVRVIDSVNDSVAIHLINPQLSPDDRPCCVEWDDENGRHTTIRLSNEAAENLLRLFFDRLKEKMEVPNE